MVGLGFFEKVRQRVYRLTPAGLLAANDVSGEDEGVKGRVERSIGTAVSDILSHPVFVQWLKDNNYPKYFRDAGHFWGVAPGTPPSVIRSRISNVDQTLESAQSLLEQRSVDAVSAQHGRKLFDRTDIVRALEFQRSLKQKFKNELKALGVSLEM